MSKNFYVENSQYQLIFAAFMQKVGVLSLLFLIPAISLTYSLSGQDDQNPDINGDGVVDLSDLFLVAKHFGMEYELEFHWSPATGNVSYYNVYLFVYDSPDALGPRGEEDYMLVDNTFNTHGSNVPTEKNPYTLRDTLYESRAIKYGKGYQIQVAAVDASNDDDKIVGPRSEPSEIVWFRPKPWDLNKDKICDISDIVLVALHFEE